MTQGIFGVGKLDENKTLMRKDRSRYYPNVKSASQYGEYDVNGQSGGFTTKDLPSFVNETSQSKLAGGAWEGFGNLIEQTTRLERAFSATALQVGDFGVSLLGVFESLMAGDFSASEFGNRLGDAGKSFNSDLGGEMAKEMGVKDLSAETLVGFAGATSGTWVGQSIGGAIVGNSIADAIAQGLMKIPAIDRLTGAMIDLTDWLKKTFGGGGSPGTPTTMNYTGEDQAPKVLIVNASFSLDGDA